MQGTSWPAHRLSNLTGSIPGFAWVYSRSDVKKPRLVPELYCSNFARSLRFYTEIFGFVVQYDRPEDRFALLSLNGADLMIEETVESGRTFVAAELSYPRGRGVNLQISVEDVDGLYAR